MACTKRWDACLAFLNEYIIIIIIIIVWWTKFSFSPAIIFQQPQYMYYSQKAT
jgi:hypothetical protein